MSAFNMKRNKKIAILFNTQFYSTADMREIFNSCCCFWFFFQFVFNREATKFKNNMNTI